MTRMVIRMDRFDMIWGLKSHQGGHDIFCLRIVIMGLRKVSTFPRIARKVAKMGPMDIKMIVIRMGRMCKIGK